MKRVVSWSKKLGFFAAIWVAAGYRFPAESLFPVRCASRDPQSLVGLESNCESWQAFGNKKYEISTNSRGLRDKNYGHEPDPGGVRVLLLGSRAFGRGLSQDQVPARFLEEELHARGFDHVEVVNGGAVPQLSISSWYSQRLEAFLSAYSPQIVVYENAFETPFTLDTYFDRTSADWSRAANGEYVPGLFRQMVSWLPRKSSIDVAFFEVNYAWRVWSNTRTGPEAASEFSASTLRNLTTMKRICDEHRVEFLVALDPRGAHTALGDWGLFEGMILKLNPDFFFPSGWIKKKLIDLKIPVVEIGDEFADRDPTVQPKLGFRIALEPKGSKRLAYWLANGLEPHLRQSR